MKKIQNWLFALLFATTVGGATGAVMVPQTTYAACDAYLLTMPAWYNGLTTGNGDNCTIQNPGDLGEDGLSKFIWTVALNIIEMILHIVGYIAVGFIIFGGFKYMTSAGSPDGMVKARKTITNAIVGLLISIFSIALVNVISGAIR